MNSRQKHTKCMIFMIPVYPTRENTGLKTHSEASYHIIEVEGRSKGQQTLVLDTIFQSEMVHKLLLNMEFRFLSLDFSLNFSHLKSDIGMI